MSVRAKQLLKKSSIVFIVVGLILTACSSKKPVVTTTTTVVTLPPDFGPPMPLTGQHQPLAEIRTRPAIMLKIDNSPGGRPQAGIDKADIIIEERVEGGVTRFIAVFQTYDGSKVGPIRSVRSTDAAIIDPFHGLFGYSGGIPAFKNLVRQTSAIDVSYDRVTSAYKRYRDAQHSGEHTLYVDTNVIRASALAAQGSTPPSWFSFLADGEVFSASGMRPVAAATIYVGREAGEFSWDPTKQLWMRNTVGQPHNVVGDGDQLVQLGVSNVIVQFVPYRGTGQRDIGGNPVDQAIVTGTGTGIALVNGHYVDIKWSKNDSGAVTTYTDNAGAPLKLTPGKSWVMIAPNGAAVSTK